MKLLKAICVLALATFAVGQDTTGATGSEVATKESPTQILTTGLAAHKAGYAKGDELCKVELAHGNAQATQAEDTDLYNRRRKSKEALRGAVATRLQQLKAFLTKLKAIRARLYDHINRVNTIFQKKFLENSHNMATASKLLHDLGLIKVLPYNPKFNPIKNFASFDPNKMSLIQLDMAKTERNMALQQLEMEANLALATTADNEACKKASNTAFEIFKLALKLNEELYTRFESERAVLREFRLGLRGMIESRQKKVEALTKQLAALDKALADESHPFLELRKNMKEHVDILTTSCNKFKTQANDITAKYNNAISTSNAHSSAVEKAETGATGASF